MAGSWEVRRDVLLEGIRLLDLVPSQSGIPSSDFFLVEKTDKVAGRVWMSTAGSAVANVHLDGTGDWPFEKHFYLDRRLFTPFVSTFRGVKNKHNFEFLRTTKNDLRVKCGHPYEDFSAQPSVMGYGEKPKLGAATKLAMSEKLLAAMKCAASYSASEAGAPHLACVYVVPTKKGVELYASNQKTLLRVKYLGGHTFKTPIPFPPTMLSAIQADPSDLVWSKPNVFARFPTGIVWQPISAQAERDFPLDEVRDVLNRGKASEYLAFRAKASRFARVIERLTLYLQYVRKEDWVLNITGTKGSEHLFLYARLPNAVITEHLSIEQPLRSSFKFDWPLDQLSGLFAVSSSDDVVEVKLEPDAGMSYVKCGMVELAMSTKRV